jgi:hypothetical protein
MMKMYENVNQVEIAPGAETGISGGVEVGGSGNNYIEHARCGA